MRIHKIRIDNRGRDRYGDTGENTESDNAVSATTTAVAGDRGAETSVRVAGA